MDGPLELSKMFTKVGALTDIHAPFSGPVFSCNLQFLNYFIENKAVQVFYFSYQCELYWLI